jgi:parvulin-like peptidyl-prolyl isomerase
MKKTGFIAVTRLLSIALLCALPTVATTLFPGVAAADVVEGIAAVVDGSVVTRSEVRQLVDKVKASASDEDARAVALETLIERKLIELAAKRMRIVTSPEEVEAAIESVRVRNNLDKPTFRTEVEKSGITWDEYLEQVRMEMTQGRAFMVAVGSELQISEESLRDYYLKNAEEFYLPARIRILHVSLKGDEGLETLRVLREKVMEGASLEALALQVAGVAPVDTGLMDPKGINATFTSAIEGLAVGTPAEIVSLSGTHILLYLAERKESGVSPFEEVQDRVEASFRRNGKEKLFRDWVEKLKQKAQIERKP